MPRQTAPLPHPPTAVIAAQSQEMFLRHFLDIFGTPVTVTPQQEISKTLISSEIP